MSAGYRWWVAAATLSQVGDAVLYFGLGWAASSYGGSAAGLVLLAEIAPRAALILLGGAVADRLGSRVVMLAADLVMLVGSTAIAAAVVVAGTPLWLLVGIGLLVGTTTAFYLPATAAFPAVLVEPAVLPRAMALRNSGYQLATLCGGPLGGPLITLAGFGAVSGANAVSYVAVLLVVIRLHPARSTPLSVRTTLLREVLASVRVAARSAPLRVALGLYAVAGGCFVPIEGLLVPLLARERAWSAAGAGAVIGAISFGSLAGALIIARTGAHSHTGRVAGLGLLAAAAGATVIAVLTGVVLAAVAGAVLGIGLSMFITHAGPLITLASPREHLARVQALLTVVQSASLVVLNPVFGALAGAIGAPGAIVVAAVGLAGAGVGAATHRVLRPPRRI